MKKATLIAALLILTVVTKANAHDTDKPCNESEKIGDACQWTYGPLYNETFRKLHFEYWHERRELQADIVDYAVCLGTVQAKEQARYGQVVSQGSADVLNYWALIPAHPVIDHAIVNGPVEYFVRDSIKAARATRSIFQFHLYLCRWYSSNL